MRNTDQVLTKLLEGVVKRLLVVGTLTLAEAAEAGTVADEDEHTSVVDSVERCNVGHRVGVDEDEREVLGAEDLAFLVLEVALWTLSAPLLR